MTEQNQTPAVQQPVNPNNKVAKFADTLKQTKALEIVDLPLVRDRYIQNYNMCHKSKIGELMYHRQMIYFKQAIAASADLQKSDQFSLYACFATAAVKGWSFDPEDDEVYLLAMGGKAVLWPQAGALVKRIIDTGQVKYVDQAKLVYQGDVIEVENGRVSKHIEKFVSDTIILGYIRFVIDNTGTEKHFIYRKNDWESWRVKSKQPNSANWSTQGQPVPGFLRTKICKHACEEKSWATGSNASVSDLPNVIVNDEQITRKDVISSVSPEVYQQIQEDVSDSPDVPITPHEEVPPVTNGNPIEEVKQQVAQLTNEVINKPKSYL